LARSASTASVASKRSPDVATITGSSTICFGDHRARLAAIESITRKLRDHADLDRLDLEVGKHRVDLRGDERRRYLMDA